MVKRKRETQAIPTVGKKTKSAGGGAASAVARMRRSAGHDSDAVSVSTGPDERKRKVAKFIQNLEKKQSKKETVVAKGKVQRQKRKGEVPGAGAGNAGSKGAVAFVTDTEKSEVESKVDSTPAVPRDAVFLQIVTGSYDRVLHGIVARIPFDCLDETAVKDDSKQASDTADSQDLKEDDSESAKTESTPKTLVADNFLIGSHTASIRCLAVSPSSNPVATGKEQSQRQQSVMLATGSSDERINVYQLTTCPPSSAYFTSKLGSNAPSSSGSTGPTLLPSLTGSSGILPSHSKNQELGSLMHHSSSVTALSFPTRTKLFSAGEDSTVGITRTRDMDLLASIRVPVPTPAGRPSGDTAGPGEIPSGINHFAVHPSLKLMLTVSKGEKCMRLWNLVTGKKDGVLTFSRDVLAQAAETRFSRGEAFQIRWHRSGDEFAVLFERGVIVFGLDCEPRCRIVTESKTKIHQIRYVDIPTAAADGDATPDGHLSRLLAVSTEDGRIIFYSTSLFQTATTPVTDVTTTPKNRSHASSSTPIPLCVPVTTIGGRDSGVIASRIKAFETTISSNSPKPYSSALFVTYACSTGQVGIFGLADAAARFQSWISDVEKTSSTDAVGEKPADDVTAKAGDTSSKSGFVNLATYQTVNRITCIATFEMTGDPTPEPVAQIGPGSDSESDSDDDSESDSADE